MMMMFDAIRRHAAAADARLFAAHDVARCFVTGTRDDIRCLRRFITADGYYHMRCHTRLRSSFTDESITLMTITPPSHAAAARDVMMFTLTLTSTTMLRLRATR